MGQIIAAAAGAGVLAAVVRGIVYASTQHFVSRWWKKRDRGD
jgi:hypothetical protein